MHQTLQPHIPTAVIGQHRSIRTAAHPHPPTLHVGDQPVDAQVDAKLRSGLAQVKAPTRAGENERLLVQMDVLSIPTLLHPIRVDAAQLPGKKVAQRAGVKVAAFGFTMAHRLRGLRGNTLWLVGLLTTTQSALAKRPFGQHPPSLMAQLRPVPKAITCVQSPKWPDPRPALGE